MNRKISMIMLTRVAFGTAASLLAQEPTNRVPLANVNPTFNTPTAYQLPLSLRVGAKLSF